jgi:nitroreductase
MLKELIVRNRSYRRFYQEVPIPCETLRDLVDLARLSASGANRQPLKYMVSCEPERNAQIFANLNWAGYLPEWGGPVEGERPAGYVVILGDTAITQSFGIDHGIAAQSIMLGATEKGLGGCMIASINKEGLRQVLAIDPRHEILLVLALGKPKETVVIDPVGPEGDIKYWRDAEQVHHVPKRALAEILVE